MYQQALQGFEKAFGTEHTSTLKTVSNLGLLYAQEYFERMQMSWFPNTQRQIATICITYLLKPVSVQRIKSSRHGYGCIHFITMRPEIGDIMLVQLQQRWNS